MSKRLLVISLSVVVLLQILGCGSTTQTVRKVEKAVPVIHPGVQDSLIALTDTVLVQDTLWFGKIKDSLNNQIGQITIDFKKKLASVNIKPRVDTLKLFFVDTIKTESKSFLPVVVDSFNWTDKLIFFGGLGILLSAIIYLRTKRGVV